MGCSARKVLENRSLADEERMDALENQLKEARFLAEEADKKYDEVFESCVVVWLALCILTQSLYLLSVLLLIIDLISSLWKI